MMLRLKVCTLGIILSIDWMITMLEKLVHDWR